MPKQSGVYQDGKGGWYFKATLGTDPLTGKRVQITRRGFASAFEAQKARRLEMERGVDGKQKLSLGPLSLNDLLDMYFEGLAADGKLSVKTQYDYKSYADLYVRPLLGKTQVRKLTPEVILKWQRNLTAHGKLTDGSGLAANTVRLARAPMAGALKLAVSSGVLTASPMSAVPRPVKTQKIPAHWSPEQARAFLADQKDDRLYPLWAFLLGCGMRIGELVWLRWPNINLVARRVHLVEFATRLGWDLVESSGKSSAAVRPIDLDDYLIAVLRQQKGLQKYEASQPGYLKSDFVFTMERGGSWHPATLSRILARRSEQAELPRLTAHGLRHTSATLMLDSGVPAKVAAERLGHADPTLFTNLYSHVTQTMQREAAGKIGQSLFGAVAPAGVRRSYIARPRKAS